MAGRVVVLFDKAGDVAVMPEAGVDATVLVVDERRPAGSRTRLVRERGRSHVLDHFLKNLNRRSSGSRVGR